jgi:hypothetical protein
MNWLFSFIKTSLSLAGGPAFFFLRNRGTHAAKVRASLAKDHREALAPGQHIDIQKPPAGLGGDGMPFIAIDQIAAYAGMSALIQTADFALLNRLRMAFKNLHNHTPRIQGLRKNNGTLMALISLKF